MSELQQNRYDQLLRRVGDLKGPGSKVNDALGELFPVIDVERIPSELLVLMGTGVAWGRTITGAVAGQNSRSQLFNPEGSGKIMTVTTAVWRSSIVNDELEMGFLTTPLAALSAVPRFRDSRWGIDTLPVGQLRTDNNVGATPAIFRMLNDGFINRISDENDVSVLTPGFGLVCSNVAVNSSLTVAYMWRERAAEPSELNL